MRPALVVPCLVAALAGPASGQTRDADWLRKPTAQDLLAVWPAKALRNGDGGKAIVGCTVTIQGTLRNCRIESDAPAGAGFGAAALALTPQFLMRPALKDGAPTESSVRIPINFPKPEMPTGSHMHGSPERATGDRIINGFAWTAAPTYAEVMAAYPAKAKAAKVNGFVTLDCRVGAGGRLSDCDVAREEPRSQGFGAAAKALAKRFTAPTVDKSGTPVGPFRTHFPVTFPAEAIGAATPVIGKPRWTTLPALDDFAAVLPEAAKKAKVFKARVVMSCVVGEGGALSGCTAMSEEPAGFGYAQAAVALSGAFKLGMWTDEGLPTVGGTVRVPIRFDLADAVEEGGAPN